MSDIKPEYSEKLHILEGGPGEETSTSKAPWKVSRQFPRRIGRLLILAVLVLVFELLVGNYSSVRSLFYESTDLTGQIQLEGDVVSAEEAGLAGAVLTEESGAAAAAEYYSPSGSFTLRVEDLDLEVNNLRLGLQLPEGAVISYKIWLTDEGNHYSYELPQQILAENIPSRFYTNLYPYGNVHSLAIEIQADTPLQFGLEGVEVNVNRPFFLNGTRMLILFAVGLFLIAFREKSSLWGILFDRKSKVQNLITVLFILLFLVMGWNLAHANRACVESRWEHHQQYKELAVALAEGHVWLDVQPAQELLEAPNPYDTIYLQANQIYYMADYVLFEGKYYVYFGIVPELLFYLPYYLLTGGGFPNHLAVFAFYAGFAVSVFGLYREAVKRWFPKSAYSMYLLVSALTLTFGNFMFLIARPDLYNIPDMGANMFTAAGIWMWLAGLNRTEKRWPYFALGSLCMALVAGCRPQMLLFSALLFPLFAGELRRLVLMMKKQEKVRNLMRDAAAVCFPYVLVAAGIMYYNYLRFGSPFDFGATYSLTNNDMNKRGMNLSRIAYGIFCFFFQPARYEGVFPFLTSSEIETDYMGRMVYEFIFGGILASHAVTWCLLLMGRMKAELREKKVFALMLLSVLMALIIGGFDANGAGILQRYTADMALGIAFASGLMLLALFEKCRERGGLRSASILLRAAVLQHVLYAFLTVFAVGDSVNLKNYGTELFYRAAELFRW